MALDPIVTGSLISAGAGIGSQLLGGRDKSYREARRANMVNEDFMKNFVQYRVKDAQKAGIHPLAALGASTGGIPFQRVNKGESSGKRAFDAMATGIDNYYHTKMMGENLKNQKLQNQALQLQINSEKARILQTANHGPRPTVQEVTGPNKGVHKTSASSPAEKVEQEYGGAAAEIYGLWRLINDAVRPTHENDPAGSYDDRHPLGDWKTLK